MCFHGPAQVKNRKRSPIGSTVRETDGWEERSAALEEVESADAGRRMAPGAGKLR